MTRIKKSRKERHTASKPAPKLSKEQLARQDKKPKKQTGNKPGSRHHDGKKATHQGSSNANKDPRLGSKKPIDLGIAKPTKVLSADAVPAKQRKMLDPIAKIRVVEGNPSIEMQLLALEQDEQLLAIIDKQEQGTALTDAEVDYFNQLMERHEQLSAELEQEADEESPRRTELSEDDLWDKFNDSDYSDQF